MTHSHAVSGDLAPPLELLRTRAEESGPEHDWPAIYELCHRKGLDPEKKSFCFKLVPGEAAPAVAPAWPARPLSQRSPPHTTFSTACTIKKLEWQ